MFLYPHCIHVVKICCRQFIYYRVFIISSEFTMTSMKEVVSMRGVGVAVTNMLLAALFAVFAYSHMQSFLEHPRLSVLLIVAVEALIAVLLLIRKDPDKT